MSAAALPPWAHADGDAVVLHLHIQPGAKKTAIAGAHGDALKIRLAAPPVDGKANAALIAFIAAKVGVGKTAVEIVGGLTARAKRVRLAGMPLAKVLQALAPSPSGPCA